MAAVCAVLALAGSAPRPVVPPVPIETPRPPASPQFPLLRIAQLVPAEVIRVVDGDTVEMRAAIWLDQHVTTRVRLRGIDAPEFTGRCSDEVRRAETAARALEQLLSGRMYFLTDISRDKYGGRVVARVLAVDGSDIGKRLLEAGHARPYTSGRRTNWCG